MGWRLRMRRQRLGRHGRRDALDARHGVTPQRKSIRPPSDVWCRIMRLLRTPHRLLMIRAVRPIDLAALRAFLRRSGSVELTTHTWPKVQPESGRVPVTALLAQIFGRVSGRRRIWVARADGRVDGYVVARARCEGVVWDVEHLHAEVENAATELLEHVCAEAVDSGALRVFMDVPAGSAGIDLARRAGFERYAASALARLTPPFKADATKVFGARPRLRADEHQLFQLYNAAVPSPVRAAEAMTYEEWSALHRGNKKWTPTIFGDRHQFVWELGSGLAGWMEVVYGQKSQYLEIMVHPQYESMLDGLVGYALTQVSEKAPVYAAARDYQPILASALDRAGFASAGEVEILVRQLAARVPQPRLVPAKLVGG
jgi:hypothetical protein